MVALTVNLRARRRIQDTSSCHLVFCPLVLLLVLHIIMMRASVLSSIFLLSLCVPIEAFSGTVTRITKHPGLTSPTQRSVPSRKLRNISVRLTVQTGEGDSSDRQHGDSYMKKTVSDFWYGANYVHYRYLELFWEYNFVRPFLPWMLPLVVVLTGSHAVSADIGSITFDLLRYACTTVFLVSGVLGGILQLPFDALRWVLSLTPALVVPLLSHLPTHLAIQLVQVLLDLHSSLNFVGQMTVSTGVAVLLWRPLLEEIQYRYLLGIFLGKGPRKTLHSKGNQNWDDSSTMVRHLRVDGTYDDMPHTETQTYDDANADSVSSPLRTSSSRRLFLSTVAFAATRLGWLCASPGSIDLSYPFIQAATSPYAWTVAFVQSATAHFSSLVLSELSPFLQRSLLLLAVQQTLSTFFVTWHVFVPLYEERGIAASLGAHIAWTFGMMTWPMRLIRKAMSRIRLAPKFWMALDSNNK
jgi:hypothetical protein